MMQDKARTLFEGRTPILNAPMGGVAGGRLAAAVTAAGGLGMLGMGSVGTGADLERELALVPSGLEVGIGLVDWVMRGEPELLERAIDAGPALLSVSFGEEFDWVEKAHAGGVLTAVQVHDAQSARRAHDAGVDVLVARGREGGGHGRPAIARDELLAIVLAATDRPVLAAGAIASARDVRRMLEAGATGVWLGTAFAATTEALSTPGERRALIAAGHDDTVLTSAFDRAAGHGWSPDIPERVIANDFTRRWPDSGEMTVAGSAREELRRAIATDDPRWRPVNAGLGVGLLTAESSVAEVIRRLAPADRTISRR